MRRFVLLFLLLSSLSLVDQNISEIVVNEKPIIGTIREVGAFDTDYTPNLSLLKEAHIMSLTEISLLKHHSSFNE